jgi:hypothetical protein
MLVFDHCNINNGPVASPVYAGGYVNYYANGFERPSDGEILVVFGIGSQSNNFSQWMRVDNVVLQCY